MNSYSKPFSTNHTWQWGLGQLLLKKGQKRSTNFYSQCLPYVSIDSEKLLYYYHLFSDHKLLEDKELSSTADDEFHIWIVNSCPNTYFKNSYVAIHNQNLRYRTLSGIRSREKAVDEQSDHLQILSECLKGNWEQASEFMRQHILNSKETSFRLLFSQNTGG